MEQIALKLQETTDRSLRNEGRIEKLEEEHQVLHSLATSVAVMAEKMDTVNDSVKTLTTKVEDLENKPAERWDSIVDKVIGVVVGAIVGFLLVQVGL